jgi:hypothetical protein
LRQHGGVDVGSGKARVDLIGLPFLARKHRA